MPSVSQAQNAAMHEAADGKSKLGIPRSVGREFVKADRGRKISELVKRKGKKRMDADGDDTVRLR